MGNPSSNNDRERFEVSTDGLRELQAGRAPWSILKELVQNVWDEAPDATVCEVEVKETDDGRRTWVRVSDDGPGFADPRHSYTLMAPTTKRADPRKRGRFNLGDKEVISLADEAIVETKGITIVFPKSGGREVKENGKDKGTIVTLIMPWHPKEIPALEKMLKRFQPPSECRLTVNGQEVARREPLAIRTVKLNTVLQAGPGQAMKEKELSTELWVLKPTAPAGKDGGWLYEMGIPVQPTGQRYDVDVMQKIPMLQNREIVSKAYLQDIAAETLNAVYQTLTESQAKERWVSDALGDKRVDSQEVISTVASKKFGPRAVWRSTDMESNRKAMEEGYNPVDPQQIPAAERGKLLSKGGLKTAEEMFGHTPLKDVEIAPDTEMTEFSRWVQDIAGYVGLEATVRFVEDPDAKVIAECTANTSRPRVTFNVSLLGKGWFGKRTSEQLRLVIHELGHARANSPMDHGEKWGDACADIGAKIAMRQGVPGSGDR